MRSGHDVHNRIGGEIDSSEYVKAVLIMLDTQMDIVRYGGFDAEFRKGYINAMHDAKTTVADIMKQFCEE